MSQTDEQAIRDAVAALEAHLALQRRAGLELMVGLRDAGLALRNHGHGAEADAVEDAMRRAIAILEEA